MLKPEGSSAHTENGLYSELGDISFPAAKLWKLRNYHIFINPGILKSF